VEGDVEYVPETAGIGIVELVIRIEEFRALQLKRKAYTQKRAICR
jgi:hypothetical protein